MITADLASCAARGDAVSVLIAAEYPIYGRFGYGAGRRGGRARWSTRRASVHPRRPDRDRSSWSTATPSGPSCAGGLRALPGHPARRHRAPRLVWDVTLGGSRSRPDLPDLLRARPRRPAAGSTGSPPTASRTTGRAMRPRNTPRCRRPGRPRRRRHRPPVALLPGDATGSARSRPIDHGWAIPCAGSWTMPGPWPNRPHRSALAAHPGRGQGPGRAPVPVPRPGGLEVDDPPWASPAAVRARGRPDGADCTPTDEPADLEPVRVHPVERLPRRLHPGRPGPERSGGRAQARSPGRRRCHVPLARGPLVRHPLLNPPPVASTAAPPQGSCETRSSPRRAMRTVPSVDPSSRSSSSTVTQRSASDSWLPASTGPGGATTR